MVDVDKIALDAARNILGVDGGLPLVQRKARIQCIVADAMRSTAPQALAATPAQDELTDLAEWLRAVPNGLLFDTSPHAKYFERAAQILESLRAEPASPLRGRDSLLHALQDIADKRWDENADLDDICTMAESAIKLHSASPPEQSAAAPVTPTNLRQALIDEAKPLRYGEPVWPNNDEANDLDKGDDA